MFGNWSVAWLGDEDFTFALDLGSHGSNGIEPVCNEAHDGLRVILAADPNETSF